MRALRALRLDPGGGRRAFRGSHGYAMILLLPSAAVRLPARGTPPAQAGITPRELIISTDKEPVYDLTLGEAEHKIRGPTRSELQLTLRRGNGPPIDLKIKRGPFKLKTVSTRVLMGDIGY